MKNSLRALVIFIFVSLISLYFLVPDFFSSIAIPKNTDIHLSLGIIMHNVKQIANFNFPSIYHLPIYYPYSYVLTVGVNFIGHSIILVPFYILGIKNIYFFFNLLILIALVLGGFAIYNLTKTLLQNELSAIVAGCVYILIPVKQINYAQLNLLFFFPSIFAISFLIKYYSGNKRKNLVFFYLFLFIQALFSLSFFLFTALFSLIIFFILVLLYKKLNLKIIVENITGVFFTFILIYVIFKPYLTNPLNLFYQKGILKMWALLPSFNFYSTWFPLTFKYLKFSSSPLFLGFIASFFVFFFFYSYSENNAFKKTLSYILLVLLTLPVFIPFVPGISYRSMVKIVNLPFLCFLIIFLLNIIFVWKKLKNHEKLVVTTTFFIALNIFRPFFQIFSLKINFFYIVSNFIPQISRLRGHRIKHFFILFWLLMVILGFKKFYSIMKKKKRFLIIGLVIFILFFENFPAPLPTGKLFKYSKSESKIYENLKQYPDYYGILALPIFRCNSPLNSVYTLYTFHHDKHIYNGHFGVGIFDPLQICKNKYFYSKESISRDIQSPKSIRYLKKNGVLFIVVHKSMFAYKSTKVKQKKSKKCKKELKKKWIKLKRSFKNAQKNNLLEHVYFYHHGIVGVISEAKRGKHIEYKLPYFSLYDKSKIHLTIDNLNEIREPINLYLNDKPLKIYKPKKGQKSIEIKLDKSIKLKTKVNILKITNNDELLIKNLNLK